MFYVYVLLCKDGTYYTGRSNNLDRRVKQHVEGLGAMYTRLHGVERLVYVEKFSVRKEAVRREREIKRLSHKEKGKLEEVGK